MGRRIICKLTHIEHDHQITRDTDYEFLFQLQKGLLLALQEQGRLNTMQYMYAEECLEKQRREQAIKLQQEGK